MAQGISGLCRDLGAPSHHCPVWKPPGMGPGREAGLGQGDDVTDGVRSHLGPLIFLLKFLSSLLLGQKKHYSCVPPFCLAFLPLTLTL